MFEKSYPIQREGNVGVNAVHVTELVLVRCRIHVAIQQTLQHIQESWIVIRDLMLVLWLQPECDCSTFTSRRFVLFFFGRQDLRSVVHGSQAITENGVQSNEVVPVAVGEEERVCFVL